jgi:hypothetical protein
VRKTIFEVARYMALLNALAIGGAVFLMREPMPMALGIVFGSVFALLNFYELGLTIEKSVKMAPGKASQYASLKYFFRFALTAVVMLVAIRAPYIHVLGTAFGLLSIKLVVYAMSFFNKLN